MSIGHLLRSPVVLRAVVAIVAAVLLLAFPHLVQDFLFFSLGIVALAVGLIEVTGWWRTKDRQALLAAAGFLILGALLVFGDQLADRVLEIAIAAALGWRGLMSLYSAFRMQRTKTDDPFWPGTRGLLLVLLAIALVLIPSTLFLWIMLIIGIAWIISGVIVIVNAVGESDTNEVPDDVVAVMREKSMDRELHKQVTDAIFEGSDTHEGALSFAALMAFATAIATFGIKADSTAVVIGAMLIAPLMTPIMALSASILMGWPRRALLAGRRVVLGVVIGIGGSFVMALFSPEFVAITSNSQVLSRSSPTLLDLLIALAAGAAGGYAVTHPNVGNSLPGVAIAVALAPPLAVVGYSLEEASFSFAAGAFLLFLTNLVGIVVAAGVAYIVSGYSPWTRIERSGEQGRRSIALVGIALLLVAIPLGIIGEGIIHQTTARTEVTTVVQEWLGEDSGYVLVRTNITGDEVTVFLSGSGDLPGTPEELATDLADVFQNDMTMRLEITPRDETIVEVEGGQVVDP